jgi:hypothetical protein
MRAEAAAWDSNPDLRLRNGRMLSLTPTAHNEEQAPHQKNNVSGHDIEFKRRWLAPSHGAACRHFSRPFPLLQINLRSLIFIASGRQE